MESGDKPIESLSPAEVFERYMVPVIFGPWAETLLDLIRPQPGERLLDVACGTGVVTRNAVQRVGTTGRVVGLDFNSGMLKAAQEIAPLVEWREGNATNLPFPDQEFDVVSCQQGLQFFPDQLAAIREMHRVLAPRGRLAIAVWGSIEDSPGYNALLPALERYVGTVATTPMETIFSFGNADRLLGLLSEGGFSDAEVESSTRSAHFSSAEEFVNILVKGSNLARTGVQIEPETLSSIQSEVAASLQSYVNADGLAFPMSANLAKARK